MTDAVGLTERQQREVDYHAQRAGEMAPLGDQAPDLDIALNSRRRPWNGYWHFWTLVRRVDWAGKRVLVPGAGYGEDAIRIASLGAEVIASDLSPDSVAIARRRAEKAGLPVIFDIAPLETMPYDDASFDAVLLTDILHHVDVPTAMTEIRRVLKPGAHMFVNEIYTHDVIETGIRRSWLVEKLLYPRLTRRVYGTETPYITADERKLSSNELRLIEGSMTVETRRWFNFLIGRLLSVNSPPLVASLDRFGIGALGPAGRYVAGRVVISGRR